MLGGCLDQRFLYYPTAWQEGEWAAVSGLPIQDVQFRSADGVKLHGWLVEAPGSPGIVLWCHGNAANVINRLDQLARWHAGGISILIFDYRGYGRSQGRPSEPGLYRDAVAAYELVRERGWPPERIVLYGQSLGAAVAIELATQRPVAGVILEAPFPSVRAVVKLYYGALPLHWLLCARYDLVSRLARVQAPLLVAHGDSDRIISFRLGREVFDAARQPKEFYRVHGADHNDVYLVGGQAYLDRLVAFIRRVTAAAAGNQVSDEEGT